jgi:tRNA(Ile)-lysidine synthase TilS/MesJ
MALCTLLANHRKQAGWPVNVKAYTIDHGVRPESGEEALTVGRLVQKMG